MDTHQNFRELRLKFNLTQTQITKALNVDRNTVAGWDHGRRPRRKYLPALAQLFALELSEAGTLLRKETIDDRCACCGGLKVLIERYGARRLYINDAPCQKCGRPRLPFPTGQDHDALCKKCTRASRRIERVTLRCKGYRYYPSVIPDHAERCKHNKEFLPREIAQAKHKKDPGEGYSFIDVEQGTYRCLYCAGAFRLLEASEKRLRNQWAEAHPAENLPRIRSVDDLRRLQKKLTNQAVFESKKPDKKIRGKDFPHLIHPAVPERTRKWRREKPPRSLRGLCGVCDTLLFSYKMSRPIYFHKECVSKYQHEHGPEVGPRNADVTFTPESSSR